MNIHRFFLLLRTKSATNVQIYKTKCKFMMPILSETLVLPEDVVNSYYKRNTENYKLRSMKHKISRIVTFIIHIWFGTVLQATTFETTLEAYTIKT